MNVELDAMRATEPGPLARAQMDLVVLRKECENLKDQLASSRNWAHVANGKKDATQRLLHDAEAKLRMIRDVVRMARDAEDGDWLGRVDLVYALSSIERILASTPEPSSTLVHDTITQTVIDDELHRWRSPEFPAIVVYPRGTFLQVLDERTCQVRSFSVGMSLAASDGDVYRHVAVDYLLHSRGLEEDGAES